MIRSIINFLTDSVRSTTKLINPLQQQKKKKSSKKVKGASRLPKTTEEEESVEYLVPRSIGIEQFR